MKKSHVKSVSPDKVCELLDAFFGPSLRSSQELSGVLLLEVINRLLKLNLSGSKWMDLHKFLEVEESFSNGKLVAATRRCQKVLELISVWQLQYNLVNLTKGLRVYVLQVLALKYGLEEELTDLTHIRVL